MWTFLPWISPPLLVFRCKNSCALMVWKSNNKLVPEDAFRDFLWTDLCSFTLYPVVTVKAFSCVQGVSRLLSFHFLISSHLNFSSSTSSFSHHFLSHLKGAGSEAASGVCLHFTVGMCLRETCLNLLFSLEVEDKRDMMVKEDVMGFADSSCLV